MIALCVRSILLEDVSVNAGVVCYLLYEYYTLKPTPLQEVEPRRCFCFLRKCILFFYLLKG